MTGYSTKYKEMIVKRMLSDDAISVRDLVTEIGVSRSTLYKWRNQYGLSQSEASKWSGEMKFAVLPETASYASTLIQKACLAENTIEKKLVLHSDNGSPMKGATMLATPTVRCGTIL